jgi:hypothetical protein
MNILSRIFENSSRYEIYMEISLLSSLLVITLSTIYLISKNRKIFLLSAISLVSSLILNLSGILLTEILFGIQISEIFKTVPVITFILLTSNLGILVGFYISRKNAKGFRIKSVRKEYFKDSIKQSIFLLLLGASILFFTSEQTGAVLSISLLSSILSIWLTYWSSKHILK